MARKKTATGFSMDDIVDTVITDTINDNDNINDKDVSNDNDNDKNNVSAKKNEKEKDTPSKNTDILGTLMQNAEPEKEKVQLYFDKEVNNHLDHFGKKVGKVNGGKSKFTNEIVKQFLIDNDLWNDKIASKK